MEVEVETDEGARAIDEDTLDNLVFEAAGMLERVALERVALERVTLEGVTLEGVGSKESRSKEPQETAQGGPLAQMVPDRVEVREQGVHLLGLRHVPARTREYWHDCRDLD